jgi:hypothetical protein
MDLQTLLALSDMYVYPRVDAESVWAIRRQYGSNDRIWDATIEVLNLLWRWEQDGLTVVRQIQQVAGSDFWEV